MKSKINLSMLILMALILLISCKPLTQPAPIGCGPFIALKKWRTPVLLSSGNIIGNPSIAVSKNLNAIAVWAESFGSKVTIYARYYVHPPVGTSKWNAPLVLQTFFYPGTISQFRELEPRVAMDGNGNAIVVWGNTGGSFGSRIYARVIRNGIPEAEVVISDLGSKVNYSTSNPRISMNEFGEAMAIWVQGTVDINHPYGIYASRYTPAGWNSSRLISNSNSFTVDEPSIVIDAKGYAVAQWRSESPYKLLACRFVPPGTWETQVPLVSVIVGHPGQPTPSIQVGSPKIAVGSNRQMVAIWTQRDIVGGTAGFGSIEALRINPANPLNAFGRQRLFSNVTAYTIVCDIGVDSKGNAPFIWSEGGQNTIPRLYAANLTASGLQFPGSSSPAQLNLRNDPINSPSVSIPPSGNGIAIWLQSDGSAPSIHVSHLTHSLATTICSEMWGWSQSRTVESGNEVAVTPMVAVFPSDDAIAIWSMGNNGKASSIYAAEYL